MIILVAAHWLMPWFIVVLGLTAMFKFARSHVDEKPFSETDRRLVVVFSGMMDLQGGIGLFLFFRRGLAGEGIPMYLVFHAIAMFVAVLIPHVSLNRTGTEEASLNLQYFYTLLATFLVLLVGISLVPQ